MSRVACGAGAPSRGKPEARALRAKASVLLAAIIRPFSVLVEALREIFDESAYSRFLDRRRVASSQAASREFLREGETAKARRPRCC